jgi:hypothetical protein
LNAHPKGALNNLHRKDAENAKKQLKFGLLKTPPVPTKTKRNNKSHPSTVILPYGAGELHELFLLFNQSLGGTSKSRSKSSIGVYPQYFC